MKRTKWMLSALLVAGAALTGSGCTRPNELGLAPLDQPALIQAKGADKASEVTMYRMGTLDPEGTLISMAVKDVSLSVTTTAKEGTVTDLHFWLADTDLPATSALPQGVMLRNQQLRIVEKQPCVMEEREADAMTMRVHTTLQYSAAIILDDGSLYQLGNTMTEPVDLDVRATRYFGGVHVTVDGAPAGKCWSIPGIVDISNCSLLVETNGDATTTN